MSQKKLNGRKIFLGSKLFLCSDVKSFDGSGLDGHSITWDKLTFFWPQSCRCHVLRPNHVFLLFQLNYKSIYHHWVNKRQRRDSKTIQTEPAGCLLFYVTLKPQNWILFALCFISFLWLPWYHPKQFWISHFDAILIAETRFCWIIHSIYILYSA